MTGPIFYDLFTRPIPRPPGINSDMLGLLKDLFAVVALVVVLFFLAWFTDPGFQPLRVGQTCDEIMERFAAIKDRSLTPAEQTKIINCAEP
jgi:hypothetical protein